ncbi:MAG: hypothetical protein ACE5OY_00395 [Candidatus Bathyarchaeia archaeon]
MSRLNEAKRRLLDYYISMGIAKSPRVIESFRSVAREDFLPPELIDHAYDDCPLPSSHGQTVSAS